MSKVMSMKNKKDIKSIRKHKFIIKNNLPLLLFFFILLFVISFFIVRYYINQNQSKVEKLYYFNYNDFNYSVEYWGKSSDGKDLIFYHTNFFIPKKNLTYRLFLRFDPRKNDVNISLKNLKEIKSPTYIAVDKKFFNSKCKEYLLSSYQLSQFLFALGLNVEMSVFSLEYKKPTYKNFFVINTYNFSEQNNVTVIIFKYNDENKVENLNNTIVISGNQCKILKATEKFILFVIKKLKEKETIQPTKNF